MLPEETALYLFCFARPGQVANLAGTGLNGHSPILVQNSPSTTAVYCAVSRDEFCGPGANRSLEDATWVAPRAWRHERVIEQVMESSPVLPARFATLFSSPASLQEFLEKQGPTVSQFLDLVADKEEWAVRGLADVSRMRQAGIAREMTTRSGHLAAMSPGSRYLHEKKIRAEVETTLHAWLNEACQKVAQELRGHATAFAERKVWDAGEELQAVVSWAFLVPKDKVADLQAQMAAANLRLSQAGITFKASGPWPPYSFVPTLSTEPLDMGLKAG